MPTKIWAPITVGLLLLLFGTIFALQGADVMKGSSMMSGNSAYIYVGAIIDVVGLIFVLLGAMSAYKSPSAVKTGQTGKPASA